MPQGKGTYGSKVGRPKKKTPRGKLKKNKVPRKKPKKRQTKKGEYRGKDGKLRRK
tara:strand:+ start:100 stop:264 length:165 start_codon:yes stop_codon:yes gene_type:complete